jgi:FHA domain
VTVVCPSGHSSESADYCDVCGSRIGGAAPVPAGDPAASASAGTAAGAPPGDPAVAAAPSAATAQSCPQCGAPRSGDDRFCEGCGYDFVSGAPVEVADWVAIAATDREQFDRTEHGSLTFPLAAAERRFPLTAPAVRIGRGRRGADQEPPEIDLGVPPLDPGVSGLHAVLRRREDGSYAVCDLGSTNGTTINDDPRLLTAGVEVALGDGDAIRIGAWTRITLHRTTT